MLTVYEVIMALIISLVGCAVAGLLAVIGYRLRYYRQSSRGKRMLQYMLQGMTEPRQRALAQVIKKQPQDALTAFVELSQSLHANDPYLQTVLGLIKATNIQQVYIRNLHSNYVYGRIEAAVYLGYLAGPEALEALETALHREKDARAKLYICNSLADLASASSIPGMVESLLGEENWYRTRVNMLLASYGNKFLDYAPQLVEREEVEIQSLLVDFASVYPCSLMKAYLEQKRDSPIKDIAYRGTRVLGETYPAAVNIPAYYLHSDNVIRNIVIQALSNLPEQGVIDTLIPFLAEARCLESTVVTLSEIARKRPAFVEYLIARFKAEINPGIRDGLASVLSNRIEYMLLKLLSDQAGSMGELIYKIVSLGKYNGIIGFLNRNKHVELENAILMLLRPILRNNEVLRLEFRIYLQARLLQKIGLEPRQVTASPKESKEPSGKKWFLLLLLGVAAAIFPGIYVLQHYQQLLQWSWQQHIMQYVLDFNYWVAYYSLAINSIYLGLLLLSFRAAQLQMRLWKLKKNKFLFKPRILPGISIIAPAYREEATIVESVSSLLNLQYSNYELIVVNDGSTDDTLSKLIQAFDLEKVDRVVPQRLKTARILGIYANKSIPKLIVIDKVNGGKADALNAGINLSRKQFFCGIDADSLLESDSLVKLTSLTIDSPCESLALGGNILPINGCVIHRGMLESTGIPRNHLARFQTIEYLRAFMAGRLGWAKLDCLLIISGAFGLFDKDRVFEVGGYLTSKERYGLDTVGEDMELVVRLERAMREAGKPYKVLYSYNSNCWTEVPETLGVLYRQRDRWQRGLIDVIHFHRKMFANADYGRLGFVAVPYFVIFELFGPLIEFQGYMMVVLAAILGIMNLEIALLLFAASLLYGVVISICSLIITVEDTQYFSTKEMFVLIIYAVIENFGIRQAVSFWRITGFFNALRASQSWGSMQRKGFIAPPDSQQTEGQEVSGK